MSAERQRSEVVANALLCWAFALLVVVVVAVVVAATGLSAGARAVLGFGFGGVENSPGEALRIAAHNGRVAAAVLLAALAVPRLGVRSRAFLDSGLVTLLLFNCGLVGVANGAYGARAIGALAPHLPLEFGALAAVGGAYIQARVERVQAAVLTWVGAACVLLLAIAATLETYVPLAAT